MRKLSLFTTVLLVLASADVEAQEIRPAMLQDAHTLRLEQHVEKLARLRADVQDVVLRRHTTQTMEGDVWVNSVRNTYDYDGSLQTEALHEQWDGDSWENTFRTTTIYSGNLTSEIIYESWDGTSWAQESRTIYTYSGGQLTGIRSQTRADNAWVDEERTTLVMSNGVLTSSQTETWDGQSWVLADRYMIDQDGDDVVAVTQEWSGSAWVNVDRTVFLDITVSEFFDLIQDFEMDGSESFDFAFLLSFPDMLEQEWDGAQWVNLSRQVSERDGNGRTVLLTMDDWEEGAWVSGSRFAAAYDAQGRLGTLAWEMFDEDWTPFLVQTYSYDDSGYLEKILSESDFGFGLTGTSQELFEWSNTVTAAEDGEMPARISLESVYPNPFNPQATVRYQLESPAQARIRVFDAMGRLVATLVDGMQPAGDHSVTFDAVDLPSGVYLVRLETPSFTESRPVTLLR